MTHHHYVGTTLACAAALCALATVAAPSPAVARLTCEEFTARRVARFEIVVARQIARCERRAARRGTTCPDERLTRALERLHHRIVRSVTRRCPDSPVEEQLAAVESALTCASFGTCPAEGTITVRITDGAEASGAATARSAGRRLAVDVGWSGFAHDLQILEGAAYEATLSNCSGDVCDLYGETAGSPFGAPSPITAGGVGTCVTIGFASDVTGTIDLATGAMTQASDVGIDIHTGFEISRPCPFCLTAGPPALGDVGVCSGGPADGAPCVVDGLAGAAFEEARATSHDCLPAETNRIGRFETHASATTGNATLATSAASPSCRAAGYSSQRCPCDLCNDPAATPCHTDADCPSSGGLPGVCGALRCLGGPNSGLPCGPAGLGSCPSHPGGAHAICAVPGEPTKPSSCNDGTCTITADGGRCLNGPYDGRCSFHTWAFCIANGDCPDAGETCVFAARSCVPDPLTLDGAADPPVAGVARPTLVGATCLGGSSSSAVNAAVGLPGPLAYVWPAEVTLAE